jgi:L-serine deaminase
MNAERRKKIAEITATLEQAKAEIEMIKDEEQDYFDNMPESIQQGERGETAERAVESLGEAADDIDEIVSKLEEARDGQ